MPFSGPAPLTVFFTDTSSSDVTSWSWDFGDGDTSTAQSPTHVYAAAGSYTVTLSATGTKGTAVQSDVVTVSVADPVVPWTAPAAGPSSTVRREDAQVMLRISNDGGKTWSIPEMWRSAGKLGEYDTRVRWNRLGSARRRVFEVSVTDSIPWRIQGVFLKATSAKGGG
jgi:PKD repeat protein